VDDIVSLCARAAGGERVHTDAEALDREWSRLTLPDDDVRPYAGPLDIELYKACTGVLWELTDEAHRYDSADSIADGALNHDQPGDVLANVRLLLHFLDDADRAAPQPATDAPVIRRARPGDVPAVLALLDETVTWLRGRGLQQWLLWPHERDTIAASVVRGEVWLLPDADGVAATVTLTAEPGPGTWSAEDRTVNATYVSRLAVRRDLSGRGVGGQVLEWARDHAHRRGDTAVRVSAWPGNPFLDDYLQRHGFRYLWTVAGPLATSRTLFTRRAAPRR
jgi:GNAT superfamily N-acetyltransferase